MSFLDDFVEDSLGDTTPPATKPTFDWSSMVGQIAQSVPNLITSIKGGGGPTASPNPADQTAAIIQAQAAANAAKQQGMAKYYKYIPYVALGVGGLLLVKYLKKRRG